LVRHRPGFAFSQLSQQYHDEVDATFIEPAQLHRYPDALKAWQEAMKVARKSYREIHEALEKDGSSILDGLSQKELRRAVRSAARSVLPNATETKIVATANARAIRHFLEVRGSIPGDEEMRNLSCNLLQELKRDAPAMFSDFKIETLTDGTPIVRKAIIS
ncbi:MAG: FAD-dependent thymidylate synthase, partial [Gallionella sp.]